jgi:hypothetical protein
MADGTQTVTCHVNARFDRASGVNTTYRPGIGLRRNFWMMGHVWEYSDGPWVIPDERFSGQSIQVFFFDYPDEEAVRNAGEAEAVAAACGTLKIIRNLESEHFEFDDEVVELPPIQARIAIDPCSFDRLLWQVQEALRCGVTLGAWFTIAGSAPPLGKSAFALFSLSDVDLSQTTHYNVSAFNICTVEKETRAYSRVRPLLQARGVTRASTCLSVRLAEVRVELCMERGSVTRISCEGAVPAKRRGDDDTSVSIEFQEYPRDARTGDYPDRAPAGEFWYAPRKVAGYGDESYLHLRLYYMTEDAHTILLPVFRLSYDSMITVGVVLLCEEQAMLSASEHYEGQVERYFFETRRSLTNVLP